jgi:hypothetical protein
MKRSIRRRRSSASSARLNGWHRGDWHFPGPVKNPEDSRFVRVLASGAADADEESRAAITPRPPITCGPLPAARRHGGGHDGRDSAHIIGLAEPEPLVGLWLREVDHAGHKLELEEFKRAAASYSLCSSGTRGAALATRRGRCRYSSSAWWFSPMPSTRQSQRQSAVLRPRSAAQP